MYKVSLFYGIIQKWVCLVMKSHNPPDPTGATPMQGGLSILKSMEIQSGHSELSVISQVSAVEGCLLSVGL